MVKIGVLTFSFTIDNYGQVLQYLATQEYLKSKGYHAVLVEPSGWRTTKTQRYKEKLRALINRIRVVLYTMCHFFEKKANPVVINIPQEPSIEREILAIFNQWKEITERKEKETPRFFEQFKKKYFNRQWGTYNDILESNYNAFCIGSDQTWSCAGWHMMLGWVPDGIKRFSIAPSMGLCTYTDEQINSFKSELNKFDFVTVREDNGLELCRRCGYFSAVKILDPVFLLSSDNYMNYVEEFNRDSIPYIFVYLLGGEIAPTMKEIIEFCKSSGYDVKYVESQGRDENFESIPATVGQWIGLVKNAAYVLTNSFHGMVMSIVFHKPYLVFPIVGILEDMNSRILDLSNQFKLNDRIYKNKLDPLFSSINWTSVDKKIEANKVVLDNLIANLQFE